MTGPQVTNVYGHVVLLLLLQLITSVGVAKQGVCGVHAVRVAARWWPFRRVTRFKFNVEASTVSGHQLANLKRPFFEK